jgi:hypothetical protein
MLESQFVVDTSKFCAGVLSAMSAMISLEIPHINVMSKMDLMGKVKKAELKRSAKRRDFRCGSYGYVR